MNNNDLHNVQQAIDQTHGSNISQSKRAELFQFLEMQTSNPFKCKQMGYYFINFTQDRYRLFGYHCIRKMTEQWRSLQEKDKNDLKQLALSLFKFSVNNNNNQSQNTNNGTLLKKKISELIVTLASHCWPMEWPSLLADLFKISQQNAMSLEMLFLVLKDIYFIVGDARIITEKRKKKIKDELMKNSKQIMQIFCVTMRQCFPSPSQPKHAQNILSRCLEALPKYLNQFPLLVIIDSEVLIGLAKILQTVSTTNQHSYDDLYRFSLLAMRLFFMRKFTELNTYDEAQRKKQEDTILTVWNIQMETAKSLYTMSHTNQMNNNNNKAVAMTRLDNMMECMMRNLKLFHGLLSAKNALSKSIRDILLGISECTMKSSDLRIRLRSMSIWSFILSEQADMLPLIGYDPDKHQYAQDMKFNSVIIGIMKYVLNHFRVEFHDLESFETEQEWQCSRNELKTKTSRLLQQCFVLCPLSGMECIGQFTLSILSCKKDTVNVNSLGHATIKNERYIALDGLCDVYRLIFENCIYYEGGETKKKKKRANELQIDEKTLFGDNSPLLQMVEQLHVILLRWTQNTKDNAIDTQLMSRIYALLSYLLPLYIRKPDFLRITFDKLLTDFPQRLPLNPGAADAFDIKCNAVSCKRRIAFSLLHIAKRIPHVCVQFMQPIWKKVMGIIQDNLSSFESNKKKDTVLQNGVVMASITDLSQGPVCHLYELLVCISNGLRDPQSKSAALADLLGDVIGNFNSSQIQNVLSDERQLSRMIQFPINCNQDTNVVDERIRFAYHIRTILNIIQSTLTASLLCEGQSGLRDLFHDSFAAASDDDECATTKHAVAIRTSFPLLSAVLPNVLKLNKLLSAMFTPSFRALLAPDYHAIIDCLDVKSLYNLFGLRHDELLRKPALKPKHLIPLEKAVIWIQNVRDYLCRIIAVSSYFDSYFFEHENAMNMMIESLTSHWNELPLSHLAIILKHFFMNFVQICAPKYYEKIIPFVTQFLSECFVKLNACWSKQVNAFCPIKQEVPIERNTSSNLRNECFEEFALRDSSQKLWMAICMMTINHKERGFILFKHVEKKKKKNDFIPPDYIKCEEISSSVHDMTLKQDKMVMLMLQNENLCKCLLRGIESSLLRWLDNNCHIRVAQVAAKLVSCVAKYQMKHLYEQCGGIIFKAALNALSRNKIGDNQANAELNILCVAICQLLVAPQCRRIIIQIIRNVPNVAPDDARNLANIIESDPTTHTNASYRQCIKAFTRKYVIGKQNVLSAIKQESITLIKQEPNLL
eukprot:719246_1